MLPDEPPYDAWDEIIPGALLIGTDGCSSRTHLIVSGSEFGMIWEGFDCDHFAPIKWTFIEWMSGWAKQALLILAAEALLNKPAAGMTKAQVAAAVGARVEANKESGFIRVLLVGSENRGSTRLERRKRSGNKNQSPVVQLPALIKLRFILTAIELLSASQ